jgi:diguanylate cyclase (GGDEF)-like protein
VYAIIRELYHLDKICLDWSSWDDTYNFVLKPSEKYIKSNLSIEQFNPELFSLIYIIDTHGNVIWGGIRDYATKKPIQLKAFAKKKFDKDNPLITFDFQNSTLAEAKNSGIMITEKGPMFLCSRPILTSDNKGPMAGTLIMGCFLTDTLITSLIEQTHVSFEIILTQNTLNDRKYKAILDYFVTKNASIYIEKEKDYLRLYAPCYDINKKMAFLITTLFPREISKSGFFTIHFAIISILFSGCIVLLAMMSSLKKIILMPLYKLTNFVVAVEKDRDFSLRVRFKRKDEIGTLANGLNNMVQTISEQTDLLISTNLKLHDLSSQDGLTGIANRRKLDDVLEKEWERMYREKQSLSLILCDLDYFKLFNDHYGHQAGDTCLKAVATAIEKNFNRSGDLAARYGGEEFLSVMPNTDIKGAVHMAELIRMAVENLEIEHVKSNVSSHVTLSLGVSSCIPGPGLSIEKLIEAADKSLYMAKQQGRNRIESSILI